MAEPELVRGEDGGKKEEGAFILPVFGLLLLLPPFLNLFNNGALLFGIPLEVVYLFSLWLLLLIGALVVSSRMPRSGVVPPLDRARPPVGRRGERKSD